MYTARGDSVNVCTYYKIESKIKNRLDRPFVLPPLNHVIFEFDFDGVSAVDEV